MFRFKAKLEIIGVNPFVFIPEDILQNIFSIAGKKKGHIPVSGTVNEKPYKQTLVKYSGEWRLYINTTMLKNSPQFVGDIIEITISFDPASRAIATPELFIKALNDNPEAKTVFEQLLASRKKEIIRYLANLKREETLIKNVERAINFLTGKERFVGREKP
jgi:hypothetical protein